VIWNFFFSGNHWEVAGTVDRIHNREYNRQMRDGADGKENFNGISEDREKYRAVSHDNGRDE